jgi:class 3 adenylate cyclase
MEDNNLPKAQSGTIDLRRVLLERNPILSLSGEWEFYPGELRSFSTIPIQDLEAIPESEIETGRDNPQTKIQGTEVSTSRPIRFSYVPSSWKTELDESGAEYGRDGLATYRLRILLSEKYIGRDLAIRIPEIASGYKLFVNGYLSAEQGQVRADFLNTKAFIKPRLLKLRGEKELNLVFQISNFGYNDGGFWSAVQFGLEEAITRDLYLSLAKETFLFGAILIMGLYHIGFYFFRRSEKSILYFSIFCFLIAVRTIVTGNRIFLDIFPGAHWEWFYRLEYISFYAAPAAFFLFVKSLYGHLMSRHINRIYILITIAFIPVTLLPVYVFTQTVRAFQILTIIGVIYVFSVVIRAAYYRRQGAKMFLLGWMIMASTVLYDILIDMFNIRSVYIASYGFIGFIFSQSLILSARFSRAFKASETLSKELTQFKSNLEHLVEERTKDIQFLNNISREVNSTFDINYILWKVADYVKQGFGIESMWMLRVNNKERTLRTTDWIGFEFLTPEQAKVFSELTIPLDNSGGTLFRTYERQKIFYLSHLNLDKITGYDRIICELLRLSSLIQIPLAVHGEIVAILCATSYKNSLKLKKDELAVLSSIAEQIAGAVNNSMLLQQAVDSKKKSEDSTKEAEKLSEISKKISSNTTLEQIFQVVAEYLQINFKLNYHWLLLVDKRENCLYTSIFNDNGKTGPAVREKYKNIRIPLQPDSGSLYATYKRKKAFYLKKIPPYGIVGYDQDIIKDIGLSSLIQIPILVNNEVEGILCMTNLGDKVTLDSEAMSRVIRFTGQIAGAIYNTKLLKIAETEREKSNQLLINILPRDVAEELKETGQVNPVYYESATILFTDFKGFTRIAETMTPKELINQLDGAFLQFDEISERFRLEKLKTIGDAYMCAGGLPVPNQTHPYDVCLAALEIRSFMDQVRIMREKLNLPTWEIRIGIHSGPVIAGVIGKKKFAYDIWGDTVNTASRMETAGQVGKINISESTYELVKKYFICESRGSIHVKNKGEMGMYFLESLRPEYSVRGEGISPNTAFYQDLGLKNSPLSPESKNGYSPGESQIRFKN